MGSSETRYGACNLCEAICGLEFQVQDGKVLSIQGDAADPFSRGHICPKAVALKDLHEDPDRLRRPLQRTAAGWQELSWDEAFELVVDKLLAVRAAHGANAIGVYQGNPSVHNYGNLTHAAQFLGPLKTRSRYSATSVDQLPHHLVSYFLYGHQLLLPIPDIDRTQYLLMLGANPMASNGSLMTVPDFKNRVKELHGRGGKLVLIDPRRTETAAIADEHHFIRPGSDAAFLFALLQVLFEEGLVNLRHLADHVDGLEDVRAAIRAYTPERAASVTGIDASTTRRIARELAAAEGGACYGRMGVSVQRFGTLCQWAIQLINIVTGNLDRRGGVLFTRPAVDLIEGPASKPGHYAAWRSRVSEKPEFAGELPVSTLAEEILTPAGGAGQEQIRALITIAGNPVLSTPNGQKLDRALAQLDFMVAIDFYLNETTRHAQVILPPTCGLEHDHYDLIFLGFAVRNYTRWNPPLFERPDDARHDWEIYGELGSRLAARLGKSPPLPLRPDQIVDMGLQMGPYGEAQGDALALTLAKLQEQPHGIDLGPLEPSLPGRLQTAGKRIRCAVPELLADLRRCEAELFAPGAADTLLLIGRRHLRSNNSWMHNCERLVKGPPRDRLLMHRQDLAARGLHDGQRVIVRSRVGEVAIEVQATEDLMPGVVSLPHGFGHAREGVRLRIASAHAGVSINDLTDEESVDVTSGNAALNGTPVSVHALPT